MIRSGERKSSIQQVIGLEVFFVLVILALTLINLKQHGQQIIYATDDAYIHLAMAKHLVLNQVFGITPYEFSSSSSSPLWTLLLSGLFWIFGVSESIPLIINLLAGIGLIALLYSMMPWQSIRRGFGTGMVFFGILAIPLPTLVFCGLEHVLHIALLLLYVKISLKVIRLPAKSEGSLLYLIILAPLVAALRYESIGVFLIIGFIFLYKKKIKYSIIPLITALIPIVLYGWYSYRQGWSWLPSSILMKSMLANTFSLDSFVRERLFNQIKDNLHLTVLSIIALILFFKTAASDSQYWSRTTILKLILGSAGFLHIVFGETYSFYRYEAYLFALAIPALAKPLARVWSKRDTWLNGNILRLGSILLILALLFPALAKTAMRIVSNAQVPNATTNIYDQQYRIGLFLRTYYFGQAVAVNDIGAVNFLADLHCLDIVGLGTCEVMEMIRTGKYNTSSLDHLAREKNVAIAVIYDSMLDEYGGVPSSWRRVGSWKIQNNLVCGEDRVWFYALTPEQATRLHGQLNDVGGLFF